MKPCVKCGGKEFKIDALVSATETIVLGDEDPTDFDIIDTTHGDSEWMDDGHVTCCGCGDWFFYKDWDSQGEPVPMGDSKQDA